MNEDGTDVSQDNLEEMEVGGVPEDYGEDDAGYDNIDDEDDDFRLRGRGRGSR